MSKEKYVCQFCGKESNKPFLNGHGEEITWCADCGAKMVTALQMW